MTAEKFDEVLGTLCQAEPFKAFTIEFLDGRRLEIDFPVAFREGKAAFIAAGGRPVFFDHDVVHRIINAPAGSAVE